MEHMKSVVSVLAFLALLSPRVHGLRRTIHTEFNPVPFASAERICLELGGHLSSFVPSRKFFEELKEHGLEEVWVGGVTGSNVARWFWLNGDPPKALEGLPKPPSPKYCLKADSRGKVVPHDCHKELPFGCEAANGAESEVNVLELMAGLLLKNLPTPVADNNCPPGWSRFALGRSCFRVFHEKSFRDAEIFCNSFDAHLASIHSKAEHDFVVDLASDGFPKAYPIDMTWIGGYSFRGNDVYEWTDGTPWDYDLFAPGEPNHQGTEKCINIYTDHEKPYLRNLWNNLSCGHPLKNFVCKKKERS
ncbi:hypothetical protein QR680_016977 [Steinernema hermaphroditum]|uniref:C-type lectin domain-containing protein n=1 Tax=Steinernema hermaphroditum TaxID=289476 RepID=A0AA39LMU3_9BILA|nr:hypothetical protein QR680_016977 [Steinernema hermaphroditum]